MKRKASPICIVILLVVLGCDTQNTAPTIDLHTAAITGDLAAVRQHIKAGSDLNIREDTRQSTPLITSAVFGNTEVAKALVDAGADMNYQNSEGSTALISAAFLCRTEIVEALLEKGADKTLRNNVGHTALEAVSLPFDDVKEVYDGLLADLEPFGLKLDYGRIQETRPIIAEMLR